MTKPKTKAAEPTEPTETEFHYVWSPSTDGWLCGGAGTYYAPGDVIPVDVAEDPGLSVSAKSCIRRGEGLMNPATPHDRPWQ